MGLYPKFLGIFTRSVKNPLSVRTGQVGTDQVGMGQVKSSVVNPGKVNLKHVKLSTDRVGIFFGPKKKFTKIFRTQTFFWIQNFFDPKSTKFADQLFVELKFYWTPKSFGPKINLEQIILNQNYFGPTNCLTQIF